MKKKGKVLSNVTDKDIKLLQKHPKWFWNGVSEIGKNAFKECTKPFEIEIPENVKLGVGSFQDSPVQKVTIKANEKHMPDDCFSYCKQLTEVNLPNSMHFIGENAFKKCENLKNIKLPENLFEIEPGAFSESGLTEITLPDTIFYIKRSAFDCCPNLKKVNLPTIENKIKALTNLMNNNVKLVVEPDRLNETILGQHAFSDCNNLEEVTNMDIVTRIDESCFAQCYSLKKADLSGVKYIPWYVFMRCCNLTEVKFGKNLTGIDDYAFYNTNINFLDFSATRLLYIGKCAFESCYNLQGVNLKSITDKLFFSDSCFRQCEGLTEVLIPKTVKSIANNTFNECVNLNTVEFEDGSAIEEFGLKCFYNCISLKKLKNLDATSLTIHDDAFYGCKNLTNFKIPQKFNTNCFAVTGILFDYICKVGDSFYTSTFPMGNDWVKLGYNSNCASFVLRNWDNKTFRYNFSQLTQEELTDLNNASLCISNELKIPLFTEKLIIERNNKEVKNMLKNFNAINLEVYKRLFLMGITDEIEIIKSVKLGWFNKFTNNLDKMGYGYKTLSDCDKKVLFTMFYNLGGMQEPIKTIKENKNGEVTIEEVNYGQKLCEFFIHLLEHKKATLTQLVNVFCDMEVQGLKKDFTDFIIGKKNKNTYNFEDMLNATKEFPLFMIESYNNFEEIQVSNTRQKGNQQTLKPTFKHFYEEYVKLDGMTEHNMHIAGVVRTYYAGDLAQQEFDKARKINAERLGYKFSPTFYAKLENKKYRNIILDAIESNNKEVLKKYKSFLVKTEVKYLPGEHILSSPLNEEIYNQRIAGLDSKIEECENISKQTLNTASDIAENFTFEWLAKSDPLNFVLGKLCNCCAHLEGVGVGIVKASIIHPAVQTLVIRNKEKQIIAKSTLYVNKTEGFAVFNNVEVALKYQDFDNTKDLQEIYKKFKLGADAFFEQYNKENKKPLKIITVGMKNNDIAIQIDDNLEPSTVIYTALNYSHFTDSSWGYGGDSRKSQYIVCKNNEENEI